MNGRILKCGQTWLAALGLLLAAAAGVKADTITLTATDSGWYDSTGFHDSTNKNYISGSIGNTYHNYFVFGPISIPAGQSIVSAQLSLSNPTTPNAGYSGPDGGLTYSNFDVSTAIATLEASQTGRTDIFNDLGSGVNFGNTQVGPGNNTSGVVLVNLDAAAIAALNAAAGSSFAIGGALSTTGDSQYIFGFTGGNGGSGDVKQLILVTAPLATTVPEPSTLLLFGIATAGLTAYRSRRRKPVTM
jgi:hypothetical protein